jgi:hypothetical protein
MYPSVIQRETELACAQGVEDEEGRRNKSEEPRN